MPAFQEFESMLPTGDFVKLAAPGPHGYLVRAQNGTFYKGMPAIRFGQTLPNKVDWIVADVLANYGLPYIEVKASERLQTPLPKPAERFQGFQVIASDYYTEAPEPVASLLLLADDEFPYRLKLFDLKTGEVTRSDAFEDFFDAAREFAESIERKL